MPGSGGGPINRDRRRDDEEAPEDPTRAGYDLVVSLLASAEQVWRDALAEVARLKKVIADRDDEIERAHEDRFAQQREIERIKAELQELRAHEKRSVLLRRLV